MIRCNHKGCGSYAFNLWRDGIDQGDLCDVHYWQNKAEMAVAEVFAAVLKEREACAKLVESRAEKRVEYGALHRAAGAIRMRSDGDVTHEAKELFP